MAVNPILDIFGQKTVGSVPGCARSLLQEDWVVNCPQATGAVTSQAVFPVVVNILRFHVMGAGSVLSQWDSHLGCTLSEREPSGLHSEVCTGIWITAPVMEEGYYRTCHGQHGFEIGHDYAKVPPDCGSPASLCLLLPMWQSLRTSHGGIGIPGWVSIPHTHLEELPEKDHRAQMGSHPYPRLGGLPERDRRVQMGEYPYPHMEDFLRGLHSSGNISSVARWVYLRSVCSWTLKLSWSLLKLMSIELVMPSNHLILCHPLVLLPSIFPSVRVCSIELALCIRWPKYWSFSLSISPFNEYSGLISFRID